MASDENCILVLPSENPIDDFLWSNRVLGKAIAAFEEWGRGTHEDRDRILVVVLPCERVELN